MELNEAWGIVQSRGYIDVLYNGKTVWLERINEDDMSVLVRELDSNKDILVPLSELRKSDSDYENKL